VAPSQGRRGSATTKVAATASLLSKARSHESGSDSDGSPEDGEGAHHCLRFTM